METSNLHNPQDQPLRLEVISLAKMFFVTWTDPMSHLASDGERVHITVDLTSEEIAFPYLRGRFYTQEEWMKAQDNIQNMLIEDELAEWRAIGPEDSELFATDKLLKYWKDN